MVTYNEKFNFVLTLTVPFLYYESERSIVVQLTYTYKRFCRKEWDFKVLNPFTPNSIKYIFTTFFF